MGIEQLRAHQSILCPPIGGNQNLSVDVRILASTNQRMESRINSGSFREDLYYRLNVLTIRLSALRERPRDVPLLAMHFLHQTSRELDAGEKELTQDALNYLSTRSWPGNVRELLNFIRRLAVFCRGPLITQAQVRLMEAFAQGSSPGHPALETYKEGKERFMEDFTRSYIQRLLEETTGNISQAARMSGLERVSIQKIVRRLGIVAEEFRRKPD